MRAARARRDQRRSCAPKSRRSCRRDQAVGRAAEEASLTSRLQRRRLAELNKLAEDPISGTIPQNAQKLMQERTSLEDALGGIGKVARDSRTMSGMIELGEAETIPGRGCGRRKGAGRNLKNEVARRELEALVVRRSRGNSIPTSRSTPAPAARRARTGRRCSCARHHPRDPKRRHPHERRATHCRRPVRGARHWAKSVCAARTSAP